MNFHRGHLFPASLILFGLLACSGIDGNAPKPQDKSTSSTEAPPPPVQPAPGATAENPPPGGDSTFEFTGLIGRSVTTLGPTPGYISFIACESAGAEAPTLLVNRLCRTIGNCVSHPVPDVREEAYRVCLPQLNAVGAGGGMWDEFGMHESDTLSSGVIRARITAGTVTVNGSALCQCLDYLAALSCPTMSSGITFGGTIEEMRTDGVENFLPVEGSGHPCTQVFSEH